MGGTIGARTGLDGGFLETGQTVEIDDIAPTQRCVELFHDPVGETGTIDWLNTKGASFWSQRSVAMKIVVFQ